MKLTGFSRRFPVTPDVSPASSGAASGDAEEDMFAQFDDLQKLGKEQMDVAMKAFGAVSKGAQAIAVELADYSKKSFEQGTAAVEKLAGAKTLDKAFEIQSAYLKSTYENLVAQTTKLGELYADLAKEAVKPYESLYARAQTGASAGK
jgi:hypothetical protein